jgi:vacuolar-type H+-ATPase catalytic subunit A/Vma1
MTFPEAVALELQTARRSHAPLNSAHEAYAVILEELDEFWEEVRRKRSERSSPRMASELIQIAAMAQRAAEDLKLMDGAPT